MMYGVTCTRMPPLPVVDQSWLCSPKLQLLKYLNERVVRSSAVAPHSRPTSAKLVGDVQGGVAVGRKLTLRRLPCTPLSSTPALPEPQRFQLFFIGEPKSGHVSNAPRIRRREPKFLVQPSQLEETILYAAAVNARGLGEAGITSAGSARRCRPVLVFEHPPVIVRGMTGNVTFRKRGVREMVFRVGRARSRANRPPQGGSPSGMLWLAGPMGIPDQHCDRATAWLPGLQAGRSAKRSDDAAMFDSCVESRIDV